MTVVRTDILIDRDNDPRKLPLHLRKINLERLLARRPEGLFINPFERGEIGAARLPEAKKLRPGFGGSLAAREPVWDGEGWGCDRVA